MTKSKNRSHLDSLQSLVTSVFGRIRSNPQETNHGDIDPANFSGVAVVNVWRDARCWQIWHCWPCFATQASEKIDVVALVTGSIDQTRGLSSFAEMSMLIKRPSWQRKSTLKAWTRGREDALIRFVAPTEMRVMRLKQGERMWTYTPKLNKSIRLPGGMMSQSWAGSDFSYNDMSRSDKWLRDYTLQHVATEQDGAWRSMWLMRYREKDAAVVWGKERLRIREDLVLLELTYFDQDMQPVRQMVSLAIGELGGRVMATRMRMQEVDKPDQYTELEYLDMDFDVDVQIACSRCFRCSRVAVGDTAGWRNLQRNAARTWLTAGGIGFSVLLVSFAMSLQSGSYDIMIDSATRYFTGHAQISEKSYADQPRLDRTIENVQALQRRCRRLTG